ncbi:hypothetical protein RWE87_04885 [Sinorhizobium meliloti]|uniref:hypothetical protein n=1 Tax=Rhizobium meliloti TaxID=382 RepID=UPI00299E6176|nr:hypothetical protein [Sinorhizobium meliloti]
MGVVQAGEVALPELVGTLLVAFDKLARKADTAFVGLFPCLEKGLLFRIPELRDFGLKIKTGLVLVILRFLRAEVV